MNHDDGKNNGWHFPLCNPKIPFPIEHFLEHIQLEIEEFKEETEPVRKAKEAVDILHSAETFIRHYFSQTDIKFEAIRDAVIIKNTLRGYYDN